MDKEIQEWLTSMTNLLNGQLRGAINAKAKEENGELISITVGNIFTNAYELGKAINANEENLDQLKIDLGIISKEDDTDGSEG